MRGRFDKTLLFDFGEVEGYGGEAVLICCRTLETTERLQIRRSTHLGAGMFIENGLKQEIRSSLILLASINNSSVSQTLRI